MYIFIGFCVLFINVPSVNSFGEDELDVTIEQVRNWASKFGNEINVGSSRATCFENIDRVS